MKVKIDGISLDYKITGDGKCITLIHGLGDDLDLWRKQVPVFSKKYKAFAYDVRGFGQSDKPDAEYSVPLFAQDLRSLLKTLGIEKSHIIGFSMGGVIAMKFALDYPEMTDGLVIVATSSEVNQKGIDKFNVWIKTVEEHGFPGLLEEYVASRFHPEFIKNNPDDIARWQKRWLANDRKGWLRAARAMTIYNYTAELHKITAPTLLVHGEDDKSAGVGGSVIISHSIPGSKLVIMPGCGHGITIEKPEEFNRIVLEFLEGVDKSRKG